jgi:hypothetical protein
VDIGTGAGRAVFAAALLHDFDKCMGIEILEGLHKASEPVAAPSGLVWRTGVGGWWIHCQPLP